MPSFKEPSFQERVAAAGKARKKALDLLKAKPPVDEAEMAERRLAREVREQALAKERAAKAEAELKAARLTPASAADMKAARDARYAARKGRR